MKDNNLGGVWVECGGQRRLLIDPLWASEVNTGRKNIPDREMDCKLKERVWMEWSEEEMRRWLIGHLSLVYSLKMGVYNTQRYMISFPNYYVSGF